MMKKLVAVGILMCMPVVGCKTTKSGGSEVASAGQPVNNGTSRPKIASQKIYSGSYRQKDPRDGFTQCRAIISKDEKGAIVSVDVDVEDFRVENIYIGKLENKKELNPTSVKLDPTLSIKEVNFQPQPSASRPGFTRIGYELDTNDQSGKLEQHLVAQGMNNEKIDVLEAYNERASGSTDYSIVCEKLRAESYETVDQALAAALMSSTVKNLPPAVKNRFEMEIKEFVASSQKQQAEGQSDKFNQKILHLATYIADGMSKRDWETKAEIDFMNKHYAKYQALAEKNVKLLNDQIQNCNLVAVIGMIQGLAASIDY